MFAATPSDSGSDKASQIELGKGCQATPGAAYERLKERCTKIVARFPK